MVEQTLQQLSVESSTTAAEAVTNESKEVKNKFFRNAIKHLVLASFALSACSPQEQQDVQSQVLKTLATENPPSEVMTVPGLYEEEINLDGLNSTMIEPGDNIIGAIERFHGNPGEFNTYANLGLVVMRNGEPVIYFKNKLGINYSGLLGDLVGIQPGDEIAWGKTTDVNQRVRDAKVDPLTVSGDRLSCSSETGECLDQLMAFGGSLVQPIIFYYQEGQMENWKANVAGNSYDDLQAAMNAAQGMGN